MPGKKNSTTVHRKEPRSKSRTARAAGPSGSKAKPQKKAAAQTKLRLPRNMPEMVISEDILNAAPEITEGLKADRMATPIETPSEGHQPDGLLQSCIADCMDCYSQCLETVSHCLQMGGPHAALAHIRLLLDCAQICQVSTDFMLRGSTWHTRVCGVCAEICEICAEDCEQFANDARMSACAVACRRCADSCRRMMAAPAAA